eukprot:4779531-Amphidinium_carterae.1
MQAFKQGALSSQVQSFHYACKHASMHRLTHAHSSGGVCGCCGCCGGGWFFKNIGGLGRRPCKHSWTAMQ